jgi:membrane-bound ClpP family serine protease
MIAVFFALALGLTLIFLEFFIPGGIMGVVGALMLIMSVVLAVLEMTSPVLLAIYVAGVFIALVITIKAALQFVRSGRQDHSVYLFTDEEGYKGAGFEDTAVGKEGIAFSDLHPSGYILVDHERYQAVSKVGYIAKGSEVKVVGGKSNYLLVKKSNQESEQC